MLNPLQTVDIHSLEQTETRYERSDVCAIPRAVVVAESVIAPVIANAFLKNSEVILSAKSKNATQFRFVKMVPTIQYYPIIGYTHSIIFTGIWLIFSQVNVVLAQSQQGRGKINIQLEQNTRYSEYEVKEGETLYSISRSLGVQVDELKNWNGLTGNIISIGQVLRYKSQRIGLH